METAEGLAYLSACQSSKSSRRCCSTGRDGAQERGTSWAGAARPLPRHMSIGERRMALSFVLDRISARRTGFRIRHPSSRASGGGGARSGVVAHAALEVELALEVRVVGV